jgi:hypothetical protein
VADETIMIMGSVIVGILVLLLAYRILTSFIQQSQYQTALNNFNKLYSDIQKICLQEIGGKTRIRYQVPYFVRVVYFSYDNKNTIPAVYDLITGSEISEGNYLCIQFKKEQEVRCEQIDCVSTMPYIGALEEYNDLQLAVNKILGRPVLKEYTLFIEKNLDRTISVAIS